LKIPIIFEAFAFYRRHFRLSTSSSTRAPIARDGHLNASAWRARPP
jgi:hypothetical protein